MTGQYPSQAMETVTVGGLPFWVGPPVWRDWTAALDRARRQGAPEPSVLVEECLLTCVRAAHDRPMTLNALRNLSAADRDALLSAAMAALERQRSELGLQLSEAPQGASITGTGISLRLRPWSFGRRSEALRRSLSVAEGRVCLDLAAYQQTMVLACTLADNGRRLLDEDLAAWPVPLGEMVTDALQRLNGLPSGYLETLAACVGEGRPHPDVTMVYLCQAFGWTPGQVERLDVATVERLLAVLQLLPDRSAPGPAAGPTPEDAEEGVTRIIVHDA